MTRFLFLLLTLLLFSGCNSEEKEVEFEHVDKSFLNDPSITDKEKFSRALEPSFLNSMGMNNKQQEAVISFYKENAFKFKYYVKDSLTNFGLTVETCLAEPLQFGVPKNRLIALKKDNHWIEKEIIMTSNLLSMVGVLKNGLIDFEQKKLREIIPLDGKEFNSQLKQLDTIPLSKLIIKQGSIDTNYLYLAQHLYDYCQNYPLDTHTFTLKSKKEDTLNFEKNIKACLVAKGFLNIKATDLEYKKAIKKFKLYSGFNEDSNIDDATLQALNESSYTKVVRASIALDKMRQRTSNEKKFIRVNLPSFELFFVADDTLRSRNRIIIGKTSNQTPELQATINRIVCYPFWKVPQSIADKEILPAVKANSNYLSKNHYRIYRGKTEINPSSVSWKKYSKNFPYTVIQDPGPHNSLGIIKLEFYNSYNVYVHDTPSKSLFKRGYRSFSHGCMRCENPVELAKTILDYDSIRPKNRNIYIRDSIDSILHREINFSIPLKKSIPIFVEYITVSATKEFLYFHLDLYKREEEYVKLLIGG